MFQGFRGYHRGVGRVSAKPFFGLSRDWTTQACDVVVYTGQVKIVKTYILPVLLHFTLFCVLKVIYGHLYNGNRVERCAYCTSSQVHVG